MRNSKELGQLDEREFSKVNMSAHGPQNKCPPKRILKNIISKPTGSVLLALIFFIYVTQSHVILFDMSETFDFPQDTKDLRETGPWLFLIRH